MLARPCPSLPASVSNPCPSSCTLRTSQPSSTTRSDSTEVHPECLIALLTLSLKTRYVSRRSSASTTTPFSELGARKWNSTFCESARSAPNLRIRCTRSPRRSSVGLIAHTTSLMASTSSREVAAIFSTRSAMTGSFPSARDRAISLRMAICVRLEPMSSWRSVAIRVRIRSTSSRRATRAR